METQSASEVTQGVQKNPKMDNCIQNCLDCFKICEQTIAECYAKGGAHVEQDHITLLHSCAEICQTSAKFMMLKSKFHTETCGVCAEVCQECANSCDSMDDEFMKKCAEMCRKCAQSCREMSQWDH